MIGIWGQGLTEELSERDTRSTMATCASAYARELANIAKSGNLRSLPNAIAELKRCNERVRQTTNMNVSAYTTNLQFQKEARRLRREAEARATLLAERSASTRKFNLWLLPLLALIPLGVLLFRKKGRKT